MIKKIQYLSVWSLTGLVGVSLIGGAGLATSNYTNSNANTSLQNCSSLNVNHIDSTNKNTSRIFVSKTPALDIENKVLKGFKDLNSVRDLPDGSIDLVIPNTVKEIADAAFIGETDHTFPNHYGKKLRSVVIPESVSRIGIEAFYCCRSLVKVTFNEGLETIDKFAFDSCSSLSEIHLPSSLKTIEESGFAYCHALSDVILPPNLTTLGAKAFVYCTSLSSINIPKKLTALGPWTFNATSLKYLNVPSSVTSMGETVFSFASNKDDDFEAIVLSDKVKLGRQVFEVNDNTDRSKHLSAWTTNEDVKLALEIQRTAESDEQIFRPGEVRILKNRGNIYTCDDKAVAGLTEQGKNATSITIPSYIKSVKNFVFSEQGDLQEIIFETHQKINLDRYALYGLPKNVRYRVYNEELQGELKRLGASASSITLIKPLSLSLIVVISVAVLVLAIACLGIGIIIPIRKQRRIAALNANLTNRRLDKLTMANSMAFKKVIESNTVLGQQVRALSNEVRALKPPMDRRRSRFPDR